MKHGILIVTASFFALVTSAYAAETQKYTYDAKGRVTKVERSGSVNDGATTDYEFDKADNRTRLKVEGSPSGGGTNNPPVTVDDTKVVARCNTVQIDLLSNDTDPEGNTPLSLVSLSGAGSSFTTLHPTIASRVIIVAPDVSAQTFFAVNYVVQDSLGATSTGLLTIDVRATGTFCP